MYVNFIFCYCRTEMILL